MTMLRHCSLHTVAFEKYQQQKCLIWQPGPILWHKNATVAKYMLSWCTWRWNRQCTDLNKDSTLGWPSPVPDKQVRVRQNWMRVRTPVQVWTRVLQVWRNVSPLAVPFVLDNKQTGIEPWIFAHFHNCRSNCCHCTYVLFFFVSPGLLFQCSSKLGRVVQKRNFGDKCNRYSEDGYPFLSPNQQLQNKALDPSLNGDINKFAMFRKCFVLE